MLILIGFPRVGKTYFSDKLKKDHRLAICDLDKMILDHIKGYETIPQLFQEIGEKRFRQIEFDLLKSIDPQKYQILSPGGGACFYSMSLYQMQKMGNFCYLYCSFEKLKEKYNTLERPLVAPKADNKFKIFYQQRHAFYEKISNDRIDIGSMGSGAILEYLCSKVK